MTTVRDWSSMATAIGQGLSLTPGGVEGFPGALKIIPAEAWTGDFEPRQSRSKFVLFEVAGLWCFR